MAKTHPERIHPEQLRVLRIPDCDIPSNTLAEPETTKDTKCTSELHLAVCALVFNTFENRQLREWVLSRDVLYTVYIPRHSALQDIPLTFRAARLGALHQNTQCVRYTW
jgi:hypothetical protein